MLQETLQMLLQYNDRRIFDGLGCTLFPLDVNSHFKESFFLLTDVASFTLLDSSD